MKRKYKILLAVLIVIIAVSLAITGAVKYIEANLDKLNQMSISNVDLSKIEDGVYTGSFSTFPVSAEVKVTVSGHRITGIELVKHNNGKGVGAEVIPDMVVKAQSLEVDTVSGATSSSKVILKAIEDALTR
jgi:uncharacterized protein with FMN-binding domain